MTYVLNNADVLPVPASAKTVAAKTVAPAAGGPGFWQKLLTAMIESRRRSVIRELRARSYLIGEAEIVLGGLPQTTLTTDAALPFNR